MTVSLPERSAEAKGPITLRFPASDFLDDERLLALSSSNPDLRLERDAQGALIVMPPAGGETGDRNSEINMQLRLWAKQDGRGTTFDSSTGFRLPNSAVRSPDASWVKKSRLEILTEEQRKKFLPLCPDFVLELRSPTDGLKTLHDKMQEYMASGAQLGWLIDPDSKRAYIYRPEEVEALENPQTLDGGPVLPGFILDLKEVWQL